MSLHLDMELNVTNKQIELDSGQALLINGPAAMHEFVASHLETSLGGELPQIEVRFTDLSVSADIKVVEDDGRSSTELPTLWNTVRKFVSGIGRKKQVVHREILKNVTGTFRPGSITLVLGQPGSGKSSLMKVLSGRFPIDKNVTILGEITYNGLPQTEIKHQLSQFLSYVPQHDKHYATLTVRETLEYANAFCGGELKRRAGELLTKGTSHENAQAQAVAKAVFAHYPEVVVNQLGLVNCQDTIVGDARMRGVSGGERKRGTTGEMEFGMKYITLMDEISTGLDSAATFDIINTQRSIAHSYHKTVVIALLQPAPEVVALFDNLLILNAGEVMYHGPLSEIVPYFASLGFQCPPGRDVTDFLMDLGSKQLPEHEVNLPASDYTYPRDPSDFARVFRDSRIYQNNLQKLAEPTSDKLKHYAEKHMNRCRSFISPFKLAR